MVITKRYNSVERFTSMQLSDDEGGGGGGGGPPMASSRPNQLVIPATQQTWKQSAAEPQHVTLMRRRSQEQLLQAPASPSSSRSQSIPVQQAVAAGPGMGPAGPSPSFFQQQQPASQRQQQQQQQHPLSYYQSQPPQQQQQQYARQQQFQPQQQQQPLGQTRSIMRPASQPLGGAYPSPYGRELMVTPAQSRQSAGTIQQQQYVVSRDVMVPNEQEYVRSYFARKVPAPIWLTLSLLQIVAGIVTLFIGALNASPYNCMIEPNIPVYLILSGILLIVNGSVRTLFWLTSPSNTSGRKRMQQAGAAAGQRRKSGGTPTRHLCEYALEGTVLLGIAIVIILGCIWVYGASRYMHSQRYMFEWHYCNPTVYWTAWWSVTLHLAFFALLILAAILLLIYGALIT